MKSLCAATIPTREVPLRDFCRRKEAHVVLHDKAVPGRKRKRRISRRICFAEKFAKSNRHETVLNPELLARARRG